MGVRTQVSYRYIKYSPSGQRTGGGGTATTLNGDYDYFEIKDILETRHPGCEIEIISTRKI
ncbi:MAG: hypothetical protein MJ016_02400 [Victivallaceae bacterium]|nr:hypothetical protein [Victivallaceae bacterium]